MKANEQSKQFANEAEHLWRLGKDKESSGLTWEDIADIMNRTWRSDETEYYTESAYRKRFTTAMDMFEGVIRPELEATMRDAASYAESIREERERLYEEKVRMWDARRDYNKSMRAVARHNDTLEMLERVIADEGRKQLPAVKAVHGDGTSDILCCISDVHYGIEFDTFIGKYNPEIAERRMAEYLQAAIDAGKTHNAERVHVALLGDLISGNIHHSIAVENKEHVIKQIIGVSDLLSQFVYGLAKEFKEVTVVSVSGNHSRMQPKDLALKDERLDDLIIWYLGTRLSAVDNVKITATADNPDTSVALLNVRGKEYVAVHGDYDPFSAAGVAKLSLWLGKIPYAVISGHLHEFSAITPFGIRCIRSGSLCGSGDSFTIRHRLRGLPMQTIAVCNDKGLHAIIPVEFD